MIEKKFTILVLLINIFSLSTTPVEAVEYKSADKVESSITLNIANDFVIQETTTPTQQLEESIIYHKEAIIDTASDSSLPKTSEISESYNLLGVLLIFLIPLAAFGKNKSKRGKK